jgi:hypothetical protein
VTRSSLDVVAPAFQWCPPSFTTLGDEVADLGVQVGFAPDPEQRVALDLMYAAKRDRSWAAFVFALVCTRQNMKTGAFKIAALADLFLFDDAKVVWTAHLFPTTEAAFWDIKKLIDSNASLSRRVKKITTGSGDMEIELHSGGKMPFLARSLTGGRGMTGNKVFLDEGLFLKRAHVGALFPVMATIDGAQVRIGSSAGLAESGVLRGFRDRGRAGGDQSLAYLEYADTEEPNCVAPLCDHMPGVEGCCLDDRARWQRSNPAMGRRIKESRIADFRASMPPEEFAREFMGWWDDPGGESAIPLTKWDARRRPESKVTGRPVFVLDVSPKLTYSAIGFAGRNAFGETHVELLLRDGQDEMDYRAGTDWVQPALADLASRVPNLRVTIAAGSQAETLVPDLKRAGVGVDRIPAKDIPAACGLFYKLATTGGLAHLGQAELTAAVKSAKWKDSGEGAQVWGRNSSGEIAPLYMATFGAWAVGLANDYNVLDSFY